MMLLNFYFSHINEFLTSSISEWIYLISFGGEIGKSEILAGFSYLISCFTSTSSSISSSYSIIHKVNPLFTWSIINQS